MTYLYHKQGQFRFSLYGKTHYVSNVNDRGLAKLNDIVNRDDKSVEVKLEIPGYTTDSKAMIDCIACHVENVVYPEYEPIHLTAPRTMTFELLQSVEEHDAFEVADGALVFNDKGLKIFCMSRLGRKYQYKSNLMMTNPTDSKARVHGLDISIQGSVIPMMRCVEDGGLEWCSLQERLEDTESFAIAYMEEFADYVITCFIHGTLF